jgi:hypothetical protein
MTTTIIPREDVHRYSEECSDMGEAFQSIALRLSAEQKRLMKYLEAQFTSFDPLAGQVAMYMATVCVRVFEEAGNRIKKVNSDDIRSAERMVRSNVSKLLPAGDGFAERAKALNRVQPHLMDEIIWALFERDEEEMKDTEAMLNDNQSVQIYMLLWVAVEALNSKWVAS